MNRAPPPQLDDGARDAWGRPLRYRVVGAEAFELQSAGADASFDTSDDLRWPPR